MTTDSGRKKGRERGSVPSFNIGSCYRDKWKAREERKSISVNRVTDGTKSPLGTSVV